MHAYQIEMDFDRREKERQNWGDKGLGGSWQCIYWGSFKVENFVFVRFLLFE
jgi:hypothetical protein